MSVDGMTMETTRTLRIAAMLAALAVGWTPAWRLDAQEPRGVDLVTIVDATGRQVGLYEASYALVIGIADYTAGWPDLPGVRGDVEAVSRVLEDHGFEVRREMDLDHRALDRVIREFIAEKGQVEDARVLIYVAGHGHTLKQSFGGAMGYVVPADAPRPDRDRRVFVARALPMDQVEVYAKTIQSKHALFLFDSCFSGSIFALQRAVPEHINAKTALPVRQFITSGSADETVPDESVFRRQLVAALEGEGDVNGDGYVTAAELGELLFEKVVNYSRGTQHPQYGKIRHPRLDKGDFVFRLPVPEAPPLPSKPSFSLEDLEARAAWSEHLARMKEAFGQAETYEKRAVDAALKAEAWRRFVAAFGENSPFSGEDDVLRSSAAERLEHWQREAVRIASGASSPEQETQAPEVADEHAYVGNKNCKKCHIKEYKSWEETQMAKAFETLKPEVATKAKKAVGLDPQEDYTTDPECLTCHTLGYGREGGFVDVETTPDRIGVGCEMCHGPGGTYTQDQFMSLKNREYKKADLVAAGMIAEVGEAQCLTCHNENCPTAKKFDYAANKNKGTHEIFPLRYQH